MLFIYLNLYNKLLIKISLDKFIMINKLKSWHIDLIEKAQKLAGLSNYQIIWISFTEGLIIGLFLGLIL